MSIFNSTVTLCLACLWFVNKSVAQGTINISDKHILHQQERMVFKQWNKNKFTPTSGFLGLNPQYWLTWALHPNYPKTDHRPLSATGPQSLRMAMALAMKSSTESYKLHMDTISSTAASEFINHSALSSSIDPLWNLYYKNEFKDLALQNDNSDPLLGFSQELKKSLIDKGDYDWYIQEYLQLKERLLGLHHTNIQRGSRILNYHRLLKEYQQLLSRWESKVTSAQNYLTLSKKIEISNTQVKFHMPPLSVDETDKQIAERILKRLYSR